MSAPPIDYEPLVKATLPFITNNQGLIISGSTGYDAKQERCVFITYSPGLLQIQGGAADGKETFTTLAVDLAGVASLLTAARGSTTPEIVFYNSPSQHVVVYGVFAGLRTVLTFYGQPLTEKASVYIDPAGKIVKHNDAVLTELSGGIETVMEDMPGGDSIPPNPLPKIPRLDPGPPAKED